MPVCLFHLLLGTWQTTLRPSSSSAGRCLFLSVFLSVCISVCLFVRSQIKEMVLFFRSKVAKPRPKVNGEPDYYTIEDFFIGMLIFVIEGILKSGKLHGYFLTSKARDYFQE